MLWNVNYYDDKGRVVRSYNQHYKGGVIALAGYDETLNSYNFTDEVEISTRLHRASGAAMVKVITEYEYDHMGRKKRTYQKTGDGGERVELASLRYNEVGQLKDKALHNNLQSTSYSYNPRGWLKTSSSGQFNMTLKYEDGTSPQWNGNISAQEWNGGSYAYRYDKLNRLVSGIAADGRSEKSIDYDLNGNIMALQRYTSASAKEDGLKYTYSGNRLRSVYDSVAAYANTQYQQPGTTGYGYDLNGNMTARTHSVNSQNNITEIKYNVLNLPQKVMLGNGTVMQYVYDAAGRKLRKLAGTAATEYISGIQYTGTTLDFIQTEEGRIVNNGGAYKYEYNLSDHLGNVRYSFDSYNGSVRQLQKDDYYPFGLRIGRLAGTVTNKYLYNGKEIQDELNQYDYGARFYDPVIGRWNVVDPMAEMYQSLSPYNYAMNDPVSKLDPNGMWVETANGWSTNNQDEIAAALNALKNGDDDQKKKKKEEGSIAVNTPGKGIRKKSDGSYFVFNTKSSVDDGVADAVAGLITSLSPLSVGMDAYTLFTGQNYGEKSEEQVSWGWRVAGVLPFVSEAKKLQRLHHIFGKTEHALEPLVKKFGSQEKALEAIQNAANKALKENRLNIGNKGILPTGDNGNIIKVGGMDVRLIGGRVSNGSVTISSVSRKGL